MDEETKQCIAIIGFSSYIAASILVGVELEKWRTLQTLQEFPREVRRFTTLPYEIEEIKTPLQARHWLDENVSRGEDSVLYNVEDFFAPCGLTYQKGKGDCEDYAICAAALLEGDVQQSYFAILGNWNNGRPSSKQHLAYVYQVNDSWGVIGTKSSEFEEPLFATPEKALWFMYNRSNYDIDFHEYVLLDHSGLDLLNGKQNLKERIINRVIREGWLK